MDVCSLALNRVFLFNAEYLTHDISVMFGHISNFDADFAVNTKNIVHSCNQTSSQTAVIFFPKGVLQFKLTYIISYIELIKTFIANVTLVYPRKAQNHVHELSREKNP